jgi:hypothetical protein
MSQKPAHSHRHPNLWSNSVLALAIFGVALSTVNVANIEVPLAVKISVFAGVAVALVVMLYAGVADKARVCLEFPRVVGEIRLGAHVCEANLNT